MHWNFEYVSDERYLRITTEGVYNPDEHRQMLKEVLELPDWKPGLPIFLDNRKLSYAEADTKDLKESGEDMLRSDTLIGDSKIAFLAGSRSDFEVIRRFELITEEDLSAWMQVFLDENEALRWIRKYRGDHINGGKYVDDTRI